MKTAEQISTEITDKYGLNIDLSVPIEDAVKQAQRDAIDETVKACAESAKLIEAVTYGLYHSDPTGITIYIDKESILKVSEKLKQNIK